MLAQKDDKFYSELKQLNQDLVDYAKKCLDKSPYFDFTPTVQDYCKQFKEIESKYSATTNSTSNTTTATTSAPNTFGSSAFTLSTTSATSTSFSNPINSTSFTNPINSTSFTNPISSSATTFNLNPSTTSAAPIFGSAVVSTPGSLFSMPTAATTTAASTASTTTNSSSTPFIFGAPSMIPKPTTATTTSTTAQPFLFGGPSATTTSSLGGGTQPAPFFSFTAPKINPPSLDGSKNETQADDDEEHHPPEPKLDKYEEPDSSYSVKCKLYEKGNKTSTGDIPVNLLGIGTLFVKSLDNPAKLQVIVRQEPDLRRILLNEVITPSIPVKLLPKAVQMIFPGATGENKFYIAKLKDENDANTLFGHLNLSK